MFLICSYFLPVSASFFYRLSYYKKRVKITSAVLDQLQVWNRIKDEVIKIGLNSREVYKKATEKNNQTRNSLEFPIYTEFQKVLGYRDIRKIPEFQHIGVDK